MSGARSALVEGNCNWSLDNSVSHIIVEVRGLPYNSLGPVRITIVICYGPCYHVMSTSKREKKKCVASASQP